MPKCIFILFLLVNSYCSLYAQDFGPNDSLRLDSLVDKMYQQNENQKFDSAIIYAKEVDSLTFLLYGNSREYAVGLNNTGYFYYQNFDYANAEDYYKKAMGVLEKYTGKNDSDYAGFLNNLGALYDNLGNFSEAESLYKESALIRKAIFGNESREYAQNLNNIGNLYRKTENYDSARINLEKSLSIRQSLKDSFYFAQTLSTLGSVNQKTGNYIEAENQYKEALAVIGGLYGTKHTEYANILNNLAFLYYDMSNYKQAKIVHKQVLALLIEIFKKKTTDYAITLGHLAKAYNTSGEYDSALYFLKEASVILLQELGANHPDYATNLNVIASTYSTKGELDSAKKYYRKVLYIRKKNFGTDKPVYAETLNNLGLLSMESKDFKRAEPLLKEAEAIRFTTLGKGHPAYAESLGNLLGLYYSEHNYNKWKGAVDSTLSIWRNSTMHLLLSFGEKEKQIYLDKHLSQRDEFLSMLWYFNRYHKTDSLNESYFKIVTALQGWLLSGSQELNSLVFQKKDTALVAVFNKWLVIKNQYTRAIQMSEDEQKKAKLDVDSLSLLAGDLEKNIISRLPELQESLYNTAVPPEKIAARLNTDDVFVNWVSFKYKNPQNWTDSILYAAFVINPKYKTAKFVYAFEQNQLKALLKNYFNYSGRGIVVKSSKTKKSVGSDLYKLVWKPILPYIKNAGRVFIIPSGLLNKISFQSLEDSTKKVLLETVEAHLLNNSNELFNNYDSSINTTRSVCLFGGADFDSTSDGQSIGSEAGKQWPYLKGSADEVTQLSEKFKEKNWSTKLYSGVEASEENFKSLSGINSPTILHIATHGFYLPLRKFTENSKNLSSNNDESFPLLRSGFVLSGANVYSNRSNTIKHYEDGIVTAQEISNLDFRNTKLITLSACETALGDIDNNEGVYGLQRAFKIAGVKEMLITLWEIPDNETRLLMNLFYRHILDGDSYYEALHKAQLTMKINYPDPAIWAGFELIGE